MTKKQSAGDYRLHAIVIIGSIFAGVALAACSPMIPKPQPSPIAVSASPSPVVEVTEETQTTGEVQGVTSESFDQQLQDIDKAMFEVDTEVEIY